MPAESPTLGLTHLQFEVMLTAARDSINVNDFALVAKLLADLGGQIPNGIGGRQDDGRAANKCWCGGAVHRYPLPTGVALDAPATLGRRPPRR